MCQEMHGGAAIQQASLQQLRLPLALLCFHLPPPTWQAVPSAALCMCRRHTPGSRPESMLIRPLCLPLAAASWPPAGPTSPLARSQACVNTSRRIRLKRNTTTDPSYEQQANCLRHGHEQLPTRQLAHTPATSARRSLAVWQPGCGGRADRLSWG